MTLKKFSRNLVLHLLMVGASLIIGLLSFGGMFALWPIIPLAVATFVLSIAYEAEIYLQNIKGAWNKLFKHNFLERQLAKDFLRDNFPDADDEHDHENHEHGECEHEEHDHEEHEQGEHTHEEENSVPTQQTPSHPQFFKDYEIQLELLHVFGHKKLNAESKARKKHVEKTLRDMEKWFSLQLFAAAEQGSTAYENELREWIRGTARTAKLADVKQRLQSQKTSFGWAKYFSIFAGIFMALGTTYLLVETFSIIPFLATIPFTIWPLLILPMAAIAGIAYGFLTYNATTDMLKDETVQEWLKYLGLVSRAAEEASSEEEAYKKLGDSIGGRITAWVLISLALGLTFCTAGTWWTVVKETRPLFNWMAKIPGLIIVIINAIVIGFSALVFNVVNTRESWEMILQMFAKSGKFFSYLGDLIVNSYEKLRAHENLFQIFNPFRILLALIVTPLRIVLFLGHLISIGVTADRIPGIPQIISALLGFISEFFEDLHYFFGHDHDDHEHADHDHDEHEHHHEQEHKKALIKERLGKGHGHNHDLDIPTKVLEGFFTYIVPLYYLAVLWDWGWSQLNSEQREANTPHPLSYEEAAEKMGFHKEQDVQLPEDAPRPSTEWMLTHTVYRIERYKEKKSPTAAENTALSELQATLRGEAANTANIQDRLNTAADLPAYNGPRFFGSAPVPGFLKEEVQQRVGLGVAQR